MARHSLTSSNQHENWSNCPPERQQNAYQYQWQQSPLTPHSCINRKRNPLTVCWESTAQTVPPVQLHRCWAESLQIDMEITAYCAIRSFIYGHTLLLNLHSMCAVHIANLGKAQVLFRFLTYCAHLTACLWSSWFIPLALLFIFCFIMKLVCLPNLLFLCLLLPASIPFADGQHRSTSQHGPGQSAVASLPIIAVLLKPSLVLPRYCVLLIFPGLDFGLQFIPDLSLLFGGCTHLCLSSWLASRYRYYLYFPLQMAMNSA